MIPKKVFFITGIFCTLALSDGYKRSYNDTTKYLTQDKVGQYAFGRITGMYRRWSSRPTVFISSISKPATL